ncbi:MAG: TIGR01244 family phosphatase [Rhodobacteraceae bacterium]|nr:TIGR01244 family phosphatase [Paracoccaceae bacterium]
MDTRPITPRYWVAPQLTVEDMPAIAAAGFTTVICNRPDSEVAPDLQSGAIGAAARAAGLRFEVLELTQATLTPENARRQRALIEGADGNVLAYCRSGTRCSVIWALGQLGDMPVDEILSRTAAAGYDLSANRHAFEQMARNRV